MHWRRKWQPTPVFLPGESQGWGSLVGCCLWGHAELDTTEATQQQQQVTFSEKAMATHFSTLAWKIPWTEEPGRLQFMGPLEPGALRAELCLGGQGTAEGALLLPFRFPLTELSLLEPLAVCNPPAPKPSSRTLGT